LLILKDFLSRTPCIEQLFLSKISASADDLCCYWTWLRAKLAEIRFDFLDGGCGMLTREENELLTRVGPRTPAGELLRRYWFPVGVASELTEEAPTQIVKILGETLVLFRDKKGHVGLLDDRCSHRGASLSYGRVEERGLSCPYHGWLYDVKGNCLETPAEPCESRFHLTVKQRSYPVQKLVGLYWAYLGPQPAPLIANFDIWFRKDGHRKIFIQPQLDCSWFQAMENSMDPAHLQILHQETAGRGRAIQNSTRGLTDDV
jgi:nitrite reductase/ring-hydroxylating ferredoxin subunit